MKKLLYSMLIAAGMFTAGTAKAQVSVNINIGSQPQWGPAGYDYAEYYYLPDIESYYYVPKRQFVYLSGGRWIFSAGLPPRYPNYDLYSGYKVVLTSPNAYRSFNTHKVKYAGYRNRPGQVTIKAKGNNGNHYGQYKNKGNNGHGKGKGNGKGRN